MAKYIGVLTSGGDSPGLNAAIRGIGKAALGDYDMQIIGFHDGFRGLVNYQGSLPWVALYWEQAVINLIR
jgi:6-phosphofructokinase